MPTCKGQGPKLQAPVHSLQPRTSPIASHDSATYAPGRVDGDGALHTILEGGQAECLWPEVEQGGKRGYALASEGPRIPSGAPRVNLP